MNPMALLSKWFDEARRRLVRDQGLPLPMLARKGLRYAREVLAAPLYLRAVDRLGSNVRTNGRPRIENFGRMTIGSGTLLRSVNVPVELATGVGGVLEIGENVRLNYGVSIGAMKSIRIGDRVRIGPYVMLIDTEFHDAYDREKMPPPRPIVIEDDVWIAAKAAVMPGVTIGRGSIVGTSSVVTADVPAFSVVAGIPARVVRRLDPDRFVQAPRAG